MSAPHQELPTETVEYIVQLAWTSTQSPPARQSLYNSLSAAHPRLRATILHIATKFAIFDLVDLPSPDILLYCDHIIHQMAADSGYNKESAELKRLLFHNSHVRLQGYSFIEVGPAPLHMLHKREIEPFLNVLVDIIGDCKSLTVATVPSIPQLYLFERECLFRHVLPQLPSLESVYLDCLWMLPDSKRSLPIRPLSTVRFLRMRQYPPCSCGTSRDSASPHLCMSGTLHDLFPCLRHLHLDTPVSLLDVCVSHTLDTLTLQALPPDHGDASKVFTHYQIPQALSHGFTGCPREGEGTDRLRIVVHAGMEDPDGWEDVRRACEEYGIELVKVVSYL